jgi:predicted nuclease of predicted toxin-antitoxin system
LLGPLHQAGHQAVHVVDLGLLAAADIEILDRAANEGYTVIAATVGFAIMLALSNRGCAMSCECR